MVFSALLETEDDRERFERIYKENYHKMHYAALGLLKQPQEAENAVHEAFLALAERFERYRHFNDREMTGFCVSIVKNKAIDLIRRSRRYSEEELSALVLFDESYQRSPELALERDEERKRILRALRNVSEVYRETLILKYYYELDNGEIAKIQGVAKKTVEMRLYRGKEKLREVMHGREGQG